MPVLLGPIQRQRVRDHPLKGEPRRLAAFQYRGLKIRGEECELGELAKIAIARALSDEMHRLVRSDH